MPLISICIPAYKNVDFLQRLLESISMQTFTDYEVVVTHDGTDEQVRELCLLYQQKISLHYYRNKTVLNTPENWNEGIRKSTGTWIKLMHDDDWFTENTALEKFVAATKQYPAGAFFFAAFRNIDQDTGVEKEVRCNWWDLFMLSMSPLHLFKKVYIGNPSCTFIRRDIDLLYDNQFKWVVDFEYYIRCLQKVKKNYHYIDDILLNIGFNAQQVTKFTFRVAQVEIPESYKMADKLGYRILRNIIVYDYYWRLHRNVSVRGAEDVKKYYTGTIHPLLGQMIRFQQRLPLSLLKIGPVSKLLMLGNYAVSLFRKI